MKRTIEVTYGRQAKVNCGNYENEDVSMFVHSTIEYDPHEEIKGFSAEGELKSLKEVIDPMIIESYKEIKKRRDPLQEQGRANTERLSQ